MEFKKCPQCKKIILNTDSICPYCGCDVDSHIEEHTHMNQLGEDVNVFTGKGIMTLIFGFLFLFFSLLSFGSDTTSIAMCLIFGILAVALIVCAFRGMFVNKRKAVCPYCGIELLLLPVEQNTKVKCPSCGNTIKETKDAVETSFECDKSEVTKADINEYLLMKISNDFERCGWTDWDKSVHYAEGQIDRLGRAIEETDMTVVGYDEESQTAKVISSKGYSYTVSKFGCTCKDFVERQLPCKHMYLVAMEIADGKPLPDFEETQKSNMNHVDEVASSVNQLSKEELLPASADCFDGYISPSGGYVNFAKYQVYGMNPSTGRKNKRVYEAFTEEEATEKAKEVGLVEPFEILVIASREPTERQLSYALDLGLSVPDDACFYDVSAMISRATDDDLEMADGYLLKLANRRHVKVSRYIGKKALKELMRVVADPRKAK